MKTSPANGARLIIAILHFTAPLIPAVPFISEFMAINSGPEVDDQGLTSDWIEIKNPGPEAVDLAGWSLTDEPDIHAKWIFPSVTLNVGEFLMVRASGLDRRDLLLPLHTNFTLSGSGEFLGLYSPADGPSTVWQPYPKQFSGVSFGTVSGGAAQGYFTTPTPGTDNHAMALTDYVRDTHFSVERGFFTAPFSVEITVNTPGAVIRYTTDGSAPTETTGLLFTSPVTVTTTTVLRARAFHPDMVPSNTDAQTYIFASSWKSQPDFPAGFSMSWGSFDSNFKVLADYGMNPSVTNHATYGPLVIPAMTQTLPVVCVSGSAEVIFGDAGIHGNLRQTDSEVPVAIEYFNPHNPSDRFSTRGALQAHGGAVREFAKKGFRLDFTGAFGDGPLQHPLFAGSPVESFDQLVLRPGGHDSFTTRTRGGNPDQNDHAFHAGYLRDQFLRRTETAAGLISPRGRYVHLCINGLYWGLYDLHERPNAEYAASHSGGDPAAWDVLHHHNFSSSGLPQVVDGTDTEWFSLKALCTAPVTGNAEYQVLTALLGPDRYIDHLLVRMWAGDHDWLGPAYMPSSTRGTTADVAVYSTKNWYAMRDSRSPAPGPWQFFTWDGEICMGNHLLFRFFDSLPTPEGLDFPQFRELNMDLTGISRAGTPAAPWAALRAHPEFRLKVADRARKLLFNDGALTPAAASARIAALAQELDLPIVAESARWGGVSGFTFRSIGGVQHRVWDNGILNRDTHWRPEVAWLRDTFATQRAGIFLNQLKARNLYPATEPVEITPFGGLIEDGAPITLTATGTIYYTEDGSDPRLPFTGAPNPAAYIYSAPFSLAPAPVPVTLKARAFTGAGWSSLTEADFVRGVAAEPGDLAITEIHYHPAAPSAAEIASGFTDADLFEFLEITNVGTRTVTLTDLRFAAGIDFDFSSDSLTQQLSPGESMVIVSSAAAYSFRYDRLSQGEFANGTRLSNSGERLKLVTAAGVTIAEVEYNDSEGWPAAADGGGRSLELMAPFSGTVEDDSDHWRASTGIGGNPGTITAILYAVWLGDYFTAAEITDPLITGALANPEGDGMSNLVEYATRTNPRKASSHPVKVAPLPGGGVRFTWEKRGGATDIAGELQLSTNMQSWLSANGAGITVTSANTTRGTVQQTVDCAAATGIRFARLTVCLCWPGG